ncbi:MAG: hypothetical protein HY351_00260 [Candidatus Omnitrophica bacterium]|nr:hypothetical protein [Candidatus Omnitrophota bacterium]
MKAWGLVLLGLFMAGCATTQSKYIQLHPELSADQVQAIRQKAITHDLMKEAVQASLGKPQKTHGYRKDGKLMEMWVYSEFEWHPYESVLFQEGRVVGWNFPKSVKRKLDEGSPEQLLTALPEPEVMKQE